MNQARLKLDNDGYPEGFWHWLKDNEDIYRRFKVLALRMAMKGRKHYSARAIIHVIRWETDLEDTDKVFRVNNNYTPGMARLFNEEYRERFPNFFRCRDSLGRDETP